MLEVSLLMHVATLPQAVLQPSSKMNIKQKAQSVAIWSNIEHRPYYNRQELIALLALAGAAGWLVGGNRGS